MTKRAIEFTKQVTPNSLRIVARRAQLEAHNARMRLTVPVVSRCEFQNIYHCTVHKTGSQWIKALFSDPVVYRYSGLLPFDPRFHGRLPIPVVPTGRAALALFHSYPKFKKIEKPERYRAFFVMRDPRDIVVSSYFSLRNSHAPMGDIPQARKILREKPMKEGLLYVIERLSRRYTFKQLRSWAVAPPSETFRIFRYEDLTSERQQEQVDELMRHCGIVLPPAELEALLARYSFSKMRQDRAAAGQISHYRKGKAGDWRNHFDDEIYDAFAATTGDLVEILGYPPRVVDESAPAAQTGPVDGRVP
ncbi:sulfotransferase domain-containing protein [Micromonospora endolithica]|uniref:Sulfotransferase n=1 Tax=Micromonospora endolithica TaxID=230091 RepID=A0A3A9Z517_9ACTN|nr:sulfotransferase domain-containing protein [Micromonospora endolithica]RKN43363.1 sulfotransferase [Micromonospora endolithica]TWJ23917.1 sulfotransferase domain-containing protein [Micromonospora endolithica]